MNVFHLLIDFCKKLVAKKQIYIFCCLKELKYREPDYLWQRPILGIPQHKYAVCLIVNLN